MFKFKYVRSLMVALGAAVMTANAMASNSPGLDALWAWLFR